MAHYTCVITRPDGAQKNSSSTGKTLEAAKKYAESQHPGCVISQLRLKSPSLTLKRAPLPNQSARKPESSPKVEVVQASSRPATLDMAVVENAKSKIASKSTTSTVDRLFYLQHGKCFYCGNHIHRKDASLDHLLPKSKGGPSSDENLVVCCTKINLVFNDMSMKDKINFMMSDPGGVTCPSDVIFTTPQPRSE